MSMENRIIILCLLQVNFIVFLGARRGINLSDLPMHFTDLKVEGSKSKATVAQTQLIDLQLKLAPGQTNAQKQMQQQATLRRDSNSTVSTYYGSMCSGELGSSRRSSQASQVFASFPYNLKINKMCISPISSILKNQLSQTWQQIENHTEIRCMVTQNFVSIVPFHFHFHSLQILS